MHRERSTVAPSKPASKQHAEDEEKAEYQRMGVRVAQVRCPLLF